jgi:AAA+ superfamily predicted ATPase
MTSTRGVYFFDEFDAIGADRALSNDVGEVRRVLNSFLLFMEQDTSESLIITATNHVRLLDNALFRRFDDVIEYQLPDAKQISQLIHNRLHAFKCTFTEKGWDALCEKATDLSHAEITRACDEAAKDTVLRNSTNGIDFETLTLALAARRSVLLTQSNS